MNTLVMPKPLGILDTVELSDEVMAVLEKLETTKFPYVREKLIKSGEVTAEEMNEVEREFKRFMALTHLTDGPVGMGSEKVDAFWHQFILFTRQYFDFCMLTFGNFIHHQPNIGSAPIDPAGAVNFQTGYVTYFGEIPEIWLKGGQPCTNCCSNGCSSIGDSCNGDHGQND